MPSIRKETDTDDVIWGRRFRKAPHNSTAWDSRRMAIQLREDTIPAKPDQYFYVEKWHIVGGLAKGENNGASYHDWPIPQPGGFFHLATPGTPSDSLAATKVAADTNPSEPLVSVGETLAELREIPKQLRKKGLDLYNAANYRGKGVYGAGALFTKALADLNLRFQFGIKPLVSDISTLLDLRKQLNQRIKELVRIEKKGGITRKRVAYEAEVSQPPFLATLFTAWGTGQIMRGWVETTTYRRKWVVCRWVPDGTRKLPYHMDHHFQRKFSKDILGLNLFNFRTIWNVLPWSWLSDWFFNLGDYISATNNTVGVKLASVVVCEYTRSVRTIHFYPWNMPNGITADKMVITLITKSRKPVQLEIQPKLRLLTPKQVGILASIARK